MIAEGIVSVHNTSTTASISESANSTTAGGETWGAPWPSALVLEINPKPKRTATARPSRRMEAPGVEQLGHLARRYLFFVQYAAPAWSFPTLKLEIVIR